MFLEPEHQYWSLLAYSQPHYTLKVTVGCSPVLLSPWELKPWFVGGHWDAQNSTPGRWVWPYDYSGHMYALALCPWTMQTRKRQQSNETEAAGTPGSFPEQGWDTSLQERNTLQCCVSHHHFETLWQAAKVLSQLMYWGTLDLLPSTSV